jgi:predicted acyl esterase
VQSGWLRTSARELDDAESTDLLPVPTYTRDDASPLPRDEFVPVRVPLFPFGHVFRADSQIRVVVQPPGGNRPRWAFDALDASSPTTNAIEHSPARPSRIVLNTVDVDVTSPLPECGALRGQPCREYVATDTGS